MFSGEQDRNLAKLIRFERSNQASLPFFNIEKTTSRFVVLREGNGESAYCYKLSTQKFILLQMICSVPLSFSEMGRILGKSGLTLKNQMTEIYQTFGIEGRAGNHSMTRLISTLVERGLLKYEPSIRPEQMPLLTRA